MTSHVRRNLSRIGAVIVGAVACWALYQSLVTPARDTKHALNQIRKDNATLCTYFRTQDQFLGQVAGIGAASKAGEAILHSLNGLRVAARSVAVSAICPPSGPKTWR